MKTIYSLLLISILAVGCDDSQELADSLKTQSEVTSQANIDANTRNTQERSLEMESDLERRQRFYQGIRGRYEGTFSTAQGDFNLRITLTPTVAPFPFRDFRSFRQLEEIIADLNDLAFNIVIMQWNPQTNLSAVSCTIENVRADLVRGLIAINSKDCTSGFNLFISEAGTSRADRMIVARDLARSILDDQIDSVDEITGEIIPSSNAEIFNFNVIKQ